MNFDIISTAAGCLPSSTTTASGRDLMLTRSIDASPEKIYRAWTEPELLRQWFTPRPGSTPVAELDVRPGGASWIVTRGPDGSELSNRGVFLEVVPHERLVFTDAFVSAWQPSERPFMTVVLTFESLRGRTNYVARIRHWSVADRQAHEQRGFHRGWALCTEQLAALVATI